MNYRDLKLKDCSFFDLFNPTYYFENKEVGNVYQMPFVFDEESVLWANYYRELEGCLISKSDKVFANEVYGNVSTCDMEKYNMLHLLYYYLRFIKEQRDQDIIEGNIYATSYYYELHSIECISNKFKCFGCNIEKALKLFGLSKDDTQCLHQKTVTVCTVCEFSQLFNKV